MDEADEGFCCGSSTAEVSLVGRRLRLYEQLATNYALLRSMHQKSKNNTDSVSVSDEVEHASDAQLLADSLDWDLDDATKVLMLYRAVEREFDLAPCDRESAKLIAVSAFFQNVRLVNLPSSAAGKEDSVENITPGMRIFLTIKSNAKAENIIAIGRLTFGAYLEGLCSLEEWQEAYHKSLMHPEFATVALVKYFLCEERYSCTYELAFRLKCLMIVLLDDFLILFHDQTLLSQRDYGLGRSDASVCGSLASLASYTDSEVGSAAHDGAWSSVYGEFCRLIHFFHTECAQGVHLTAVFILMIVLRSILYEMCTKVEEATHLPSAARPNARITSDAAEIRNDSLQTIPLDALLKLMQKWHLNCTRMESLVCCYALLLHKPQFANCVPSEASRESSIMMITGTNTACAKNPTLFKQIYLDNLTLDTVFKQGRRLLPDMMGRWIVHWGLEPEQVSHLYQDMCGQTQRVDDQGNVGIYTNSRIFGSQTIDIFSLVYDHLPCTLQSDYLFASAAWEYCRKWSEDWELNNDCLHKSIAFLGQLGSAGTTIGQGLASLMWQNYFSGHLQTAVQCCTKSVIEPNLPLQAFCSSMVELFAQYLKLISCQDAVPIFSMECEWESNSHEFDQSPKSRSASISSIRSQQDLAHVAVAQPSHASLSRQTVAQKPTLAEVAADQAVLALSADSLTSLHQLAICTAFLLAFASCSQSSRQSPPLHDDIRILDLFSALDRDSLQGVLSERWAASPVDARDKKVIESRERFLEWMLKAIVSDFERSSTQPSIEQAPLARRLKSSNLQAKTFMRPSVAFHFFINCAIRLGGYWTKDKNLLWTRILVLLFNHNLDEQAWLVTDRLYLATSLLLVVGRRFAAIFFDSNNQCSKRFLQLKTRCSMALLTYLSSFTNSKRPVDLGSDHEVEPGLTDDSLATLEKKFKELLRLLDFVMPYLQTKASTYELACELRDLIEFYLT